MDFKEYIGKEIKCSCGRVHSVPVKLIDIDRGALKRLSGNIKKLGFSHAFIIEDKNTYEAAGKTVEELLLADGIKADKVIIDGDEPVPDERTIGQIMAAFCEGPDFILGVGSGVINDLCKFIAARLKLEYIIVATAPSMDGFVSVGSALMLNKVKTTIDCTQPAAVIGDTEILAAAPMDMITAGLGDILGKYTCILDWKIAHIVNGEYYCPQVAGMVEEALRSVEEHKDELSERSPEAIKTIMEGLVITGSAMSFVGNSRPASGCEHHMSHLWEMRAIMEGRKVVPHGTQVGIGMIAALYLYRELAGEKIDFDAAKNACFDFEKWKENVREVFKDAASGIIALEERTKKNDPEGRRARVEAIEKNFDRIKKLIDESLPRLEDVEKLMISLGAPINPLEVGISLSLVDSAVNYAKEVRDRYTLLGILSDLGLSEKYGKKAVSYFEKGQSIYYENIKRIQAEKLKNIRLFVLDMDGTIYLENRLFPFTRDFLKKVESTGREYCYFTNNSSKNQRDYLEKLDILGIPVKPEKMFLSTQVIIEYLMKNYPDKKKVYVVGTPSLERSFEESGYVMDDASPDMVILGFDTTLTYDKLVKACDFVRDGCLYFGVNCDYNCPVKDGGYIPDCGSIAKLVERSAGRLPEFFGKPSRHTLDYIVEHTGYRMDEIAVVGDRIYTDIALANGTPVVSVMVLTGEGSVNDLEDYDFSPDIIVESLESLAELI
ncbi:MAG: HAD-IIA family hydrolase [Lachnospiraceae bacterium]|jgi:glycerol-1-phosphate dehydrogenase [NAD(P)+]